MGDGTGKRGIDEGRDRDIVGLRWIWNFGWLRSVELGRLIWPGQVHSRKYGERITRKWLSKNLVLARDLPDHAGAAYVLSAAGAEYLVTTCGIDAVSGKDWGDTTAGKWVAPKWWRHDLLQSGVLSFYYERGNKIIPERQLRRENPTLAKIPDGVIISKSDRKYWLEVESTRKTGKNMANLATALIECTENRAPILSGHLTTYPLVAFSGEAKDERGYQLDHESRVVTAIRKQLKSDINIKFAELKLSGPGVSDVKTKDLLIDADLISRAIDVLGKKGVIKATKERVCVFLYGYDCCVEETDNGAAWELRTHESVSVASGNSHSFAAAKRAVVSAWLSNIDPAIEL